MDTAVQSWMSWEGGVDLVAMTQEGLPVPNVIVHFARLVHTPVGSAPAGMLLLPGADGQPMFGGFVANDEKVGRYFGPHIFAGTPFENAPILRGEIAVEVQGDPRAPSLAKITVTLPGYVIESELSRFTPLQVAERTSANLPFHDRSLEAVANGVRLRVNGKELSVVLPATGMSGGPPAVWAPCGLYWR